MNIRNQRICIHLSLVFIIFTGVGLFFMTGWLPPPAPSLDAGATAREFARGGVMRVGLAIVAFVSPFFMAFAAAISAQMRRIEGPHHVFSNLQLACAAVGVLAIQFPAFFWLAISYRAETPAAIIVTLNDIGWFLMLGATGPAVLQNLSIGFCILGDESDGTIYPRWLGYMNLWLAITLLPGVLLPFFKVGPFAWNGILGFWMVAVGFFAWAIINYVYTAKAIERQARAGA